MPTYELVGLYDCPWMAKGEKLLEQVQFQFPIVDYHKSMKDRIQWKDFVKKMKHVRGWTIKRSPVIWELLVSQKGKVNYIGGIDEFCEYIYSFFGILCENDSTAALLEQVAINKALFGKGFQGLDRGNKTICNLSIINGPMKMLECILTQLLSPISIVPPFILFNIKLFSDVLTQRELDGLSMEAVDMCSSNLFKISVGTTVSEVLYDAHLVFVLDDFTKRVEEEVEDWINRIQWRAFKHAETMNQVCGNECRLIIGGDGPQCLIAEIFRKTLSLRKVQSGHLVAVGQHVVNRAKGIISRKTQVPPGCISRVHAWGWPGSVGAYVEVKDALVRDAQCSIQGPSPCEIPLGEIGLNPEWLFNNFANEYLLNQKEHVLKTRSFHTSDLCLAEALVQTLHIMLTSQIPSSQKPKICCRRPPSSSSANTNPKSIAPSENSDSNPVTPRTTAQDNNNNDNMDSEEWENLEIILPVISVGIPCSRKSSFPHGTFMVQPAVCYYGKWVPAGKVSSSTHERVVKEIEKLWGRRQEMIFARFLGPNVNVVGGVFSDSEEEAAIRAKVEGQNVNEDEEYYGENA